MVQPRFVVPPQSESGDRRDDSFRADPAKGAVPGGGLSPEFCALIYDTDAQAINDDYYVTSADFLELRSSIRRGLARGLLAWGIGLLMAVAALGFVYA
jgi:hypothetical protein